MRFNELLSMAEIIYINLLDEGIDCWRPVKAELISGNTYKILPQEKPDDEIWEFMPGTSVNCRLEKKRDGLTQVEVMIAFEKTDKND